MNDPKPTDKVIKFISRSAEAAFGALPPGWDLSQAYATAPYVFALDCVECNVPIGHWGADDSQMWHISSTIMSAAKEHWHWQTWAHARKEAMAAQPMAPAQKPEPNNDVMTAREALHREAMWGLTIGGVEDAVTEAHRLIDAYAHELAEKIRSMIDANDTYVLAYEAADLIDPQVQQ